MNPYLAEMSGLILAVVIVVGVAVLIALAIILSFISVWVRALTSGAKVKITELVALRLQQVRDRTDG